MCLDVCLPPEVELGTELAQATRLTTAWAARQRTAPRAPGQPVLDRGARATPTYAAARSRRSPSPTLDGNALGVGLEAWGRPSDDVRDGRVVRALLPRDKPRYFMGTRPEGVPR